VLYGRFESAMLTRDTNSLEPDAAELKFYAPGIGPVLTLDVSGGSGREELVEMSTVPDGTGTGRSGRPIDGGDRGFGASRLANRRTGRECRKHARHGPAKSRPDKTKGLGVCRLVGTFLGRSSSGCAH